MSIRINFGRLLLLGALVALLGACGGSPPVALNGTVTDAYTNKPVSGATVKVGDAQATTDAAGKYQIAKWSAKDTLQVSAQGYEQASVPLESQPQLAKPAPPAATLDAKIRPNTLAGAILDGASGKPIAGAVVQAGPTLSATTGPDGRYTLAGVPENVALSITAPDHEARKENVQRTTAFDAKLRSNVVTGVITDKETGKPIAGVTVKAGNVSATTGADGKYRLEGVAPNATVEVSSAGYSAASKPLGQETTFDAALQSNVLSGMVKDQYTGAAIAGATVKAGAATATTGADGRYRLEGASGNLEVEISAPGYAAVKQTLQKLAPLDAALRPNVLKSKLVDGKTGAPVKNATIIATTEITGTDVAFARIDNSADGAFALENIPEQGFIKVVAPGYRRADLELKPGQVPETIKLEPFAAKALYITAGMASSGLKVVNEYLDLIDRTELNAIIIDLKSDMRDDLGTVYYNSQAPMVKELGTAKDYVDFPAILAEAKKRGIYTIARVQNFSHDNALADARPEWAIKDRKTGKVYADYPGPGIRYAWLDEWNRNVWQYNIQLSVEAARMGFDEINYDYIRYPDGDPATYSQDFQFSQPTDPVNNSEAMFNNIATYLEQSQRAINGAGAFLSIDVFGRVVLGPSKLIGQDIARMAAHTDYIAPMIYPSLWWVSYLGFDNPTAHPYEVIFESLNSGAKLFEGKRALQRPWLQDHTDPWQGARVVKYGPKEVRAQIDAAEASGKAPGGWMLYNSANQYTEEALKPEK
jgi:protocatechuate 3,4-dioxygenase beta subunit